MIQFIFYSFLILIVFLNTNLFAKPRCEVLYDVIYNKGAHKDVSLKTTVNQKSIGIKLQKFWNEKKVLKFEDGKEIKTSGWELEKNSEGYFKVGKITDGLLQKYSSPGKIEVGDIILSINDIDLREVAKDQKKLRILEDDISDLFKKNEKIKFKLLKKGKIIEVNKINILEVEETDIKNKIQNFNEPFIDFFVNSISIDEKSGSFTATIETSYKEYLDFRYSLTSITKDALIENKKYKDGKLIGFQWYQCTFSDERWNKLDTVDPNYGMRFNNLISQDNSLKNSNYNIKPGFYVSNKGYEINDAKLTYNSIGVYKIKNNFNLRTFPFDKQKLNIHIYNEKFTDTFRSSVSSDSMQRALKFKNDNQIQGWDIDNVSLKYKFFQDPHKSLKLYDGISLEIDVSRKHSYYIFKIILPIFLILSLCWSSVWLPPKEIQSRLTVTIVCLLSLIAYNFVIDADIPKLEYLTIMDYIILISYIYAAIPCLLAVISYNFVCNNKDQFCIKLEGFEKRYGLLSYLLIITILIIVTMFQNAKYASGFLF